MLKAGAPDPTVVAFGSLNEARIDRSRKWMAAGVDVMIKWSLTETGASYYQFGNPKICMELTRDWLADRLGFDIGYRPMWVDA